MQGGCSPLRIHAIKQVRDVVKEFGINMVESHILFKILDMYKGLKMIGTEELTISSLFDECLKRK